MKRIIFAAPTILFWYYKCQKAFHWIFKYRDKLPKYNTFKYSLKVWLTSVLASPLLFFAVILYKEGIYNSNLLHSLSSLLLVYAMFITAEVLLSYGSWLVFLAAVSLLIVIHVKASVQCCLIFLTAILLTVAPFIVILYPGGSFREIDYYIYFMLCTCVCTCGSVRYYKLKPILKS